MNLWATLLILLFLKQLIIIIISWLKQVPKPGFLGYLTNYFSAGVTEERFWEIRPVPRTFLGIFRFIKFISVGYFDIPGNVEIKDRMGKITHPYVRKDRWNDNWVLGRWLTIILLYFFPIPDWSLLVAVQSVFIIDTLSSTLSTAFVNSIREPVINGNIKIRTCLVFIGNVFSMIIAFASIYKSIPRAPLGNTYLMFSFKSFFFQAPKIESAWPNEIFIFHASEIAMGFLMIFIFFTVLSRFVTAKGSS